MKAMARQRTHSIAFKRQVAQEFIAGESLYALSKRHDISRGAEYVVRAVRDDINRRPVCSADGPLPTPFGLRCLLDAVVTGGKSAWIYPLAIAAREIRMRRSLATTLATAPPT